MTLIHPLLSSSLEIPLEDLFPKWRENIICRHCKMYLSKMQNIIVRNQKHCIFAKKTWHGSPQISKKLSSSLSCQKLHLKTLFYFHQVRNWARPFSRMLSINIFRFKLAFRTNYWYWGERDWGTGQKSVTMHLWILKGENLNEFFWYLKICKLVWQKAAQNIFFSQIVPGFKSWLLPGTNFPTALGRACPTRLI